MYKLHNVSCVRFVESFNTPAFNLTSDFITAIVLFDASASVPKTTSDHNAKPKSCP